MKKGFTTVEALIAVGIIQILIFGALTLMQRLPSMNKKASDELNYSVLRNQLFVLLSDDRAWFHMLENSGVNTNLRCFRAQASQANPQRDCRTRNGPFVVYNIKGAQEYNFTDPTTGIRSNGEICTGFVAPPGVPNPACPLRLDLRWEPVCPPAPEACVNPLIRVVGNYIWNGAPDQKSPPLHRLNFRMHHSTNYCPGTASGSPSTTPAGPINIVLEPAPSSPALVSPNQIRSSLTTATPSSQIGRFDQDLPPCRTAVISYQEQITTIAGLGNNSSVCLKDSPTAPTCLFEVRRETIAGVAVLQLLYNGIPEAAAVTSHLTLTSGTMFTLMVKKNRVELLVDSTSVYTWPQKLTDAFRVQFTPASQAYSTQGFFNITPVVPAVTL